LESSRPLAIPRAEKYRGKPSTWGLIERAC
jgi:hypothetical protein